VIAILLVTFAGCSGDTAAAAAADAQKRVCESNATLQGSISSAASNRSHSHVNATGIMARRRRQAGHSRLCHARDHGNGPDFVPPADRIATFDNDGTL
jgi:hypothetical protein